MEKKDLKKLLASLGIASLISAGGSMALPANAASGSGWTGPKDDAGSVENAVQEQADSAASAVQEKAEEAADAAGEEAKKTAEDAVDTAVEEVKKKAGDSGWSGSK